MKPEDMSNLGFHIPVPEPPPVVVRKVSNLFATEVFFLFTIFDCFYFFFSLQENVGFVAGK